MSHTIEKCFRTSKKILGFMGVYPSEDDTVFSNVKKFAFYFGFLVFPVISMVRRLLLEKISDIEGKTFLIIYLSQTLPFSFKVMSFFTNGRKFKTCVIFFEHPRFAPSGKEDRTIIEEYVNIGEKIAAGYLLLILFSISAIFIIPAFFGKLTIYIWRVHLPNTYSLQYWLLGLVQCTCVTYQSYSGTTPDAIIGGLLYHAAGQSRILKHNLQHLSTLVEEYKHQNEWNIIKYENVDKYLKRCVERHLGIINFVEEFEECFSWPILYQLSACMFCLCFAFVGLLTASSGSDLVPALISSAFSVAQLFYYCFFGTLLEEEMSTLNDSIYMGSWYQYDVAIRKTLIIIMERAKQPMTVTAGKVFPLTLRTFVSVIKSSYSMVAVFRDLSF